MPPPPQLLAIGALGAIGGAAVAMKRAANRAAEARAAQDADKSKEKMLENMRRHQEAEAERQRTAKQRRSNQRRSSLPCEDHRDLVRREWETLMTLEFRRIERMLRRKQATQLAAGKTFCALPLVGRPEEPNWVLLAVALAWGNPSIWHADGMYDLLLHHLCQPFAAGTTRASAFSRNEVTLPHHLP